MTPAAIFDVDGTLCATRSTSSLLWLRQRQLPVWRHQLWLASLAWRAPLAWALDRFSRDAADRLVYAQYAGLSRRQLEEDARRCCQELLLPSCFPGALAEMAAHRAAGRRVVLLSGGIDVVLAPLADALGADLLAQRLDVSGDRYTGTYRSYAELGDGAAAGDQAGRKAAALRQFAARVGIDLRASTAYGDSLNDLAMLESIGTPVVVNPGRRLAALARRRAWTIRQWRLEE